MIEAIAHSYFEHVLLKTSHAEGPRQNIALSDNKYKVSQRHTMGEDISIAEAATMRDKGNEALFFPATAFALLYFP